MINKVMKTIFLLMLIMLMITGCDEVTEPETVEDPTEYGDYELIWSDEFDGEELDSSKWVYDLGYGDVGWGNDEWQEYTEEPANVKVEGGYLEINAAYDSLNYASPGKRDGSVTSARIKTEGNFSFKYGKVQAKIKPPVSMGMWPAFWMLGSNFDTVGWPQCGEIDIMEMSPLYHNSGTSLFTLHWWDDILDDHASYGTSYQFDYSLGDDFHIFEVEWDQQRIVGRVDGIAYFVRVIDNDTMNEFLREFFLILNVAVGGNLGGTPDATTTWEEKMYVDWVRVYQRATEEEIINSFGLFTDETEVDAGLAIGVDAEIYVWENTLTGGSTPPYEGDNVISWSTTGAGWFGGGISSNIPQDLSGFAEGYLKFMIKIPANVSFKIGINDISGNENYVEFPANQAAFGLERDGNWGQAVIPIANLQGGVDLSTLSYEFIILEENGTQCQLALDDIYWDGGGAGPSSVSFDAGSYMVDDTAAGIMVYDYEAAGTTVAVEVDNGTDTIRIEFVLSDEGAGTGTVNFGVTNDDTDTIGIMAGGSLTVSYTDTEGNIRTDTAAIEGSSGGDALGIFSETHTAQMLVYQQIINSADWSGNSSVPDEQSTGVTPLEGNYVLSVNYESGSAGWGGIAFDFGTPGQDITAYNTFVININKSAMPTLSKLGIKFEDTVQGQTELNISDYSAVIDGDWMRYEIPLSDFSAPDLTDVKYLGLWNPQDSSNTLLTGFLYFDDIYLINR